MHIEYAFQMSTYTKLRRILISCRISNSLKWVYAPFTVDESSKLAPCNFVGNKDLDEVLRSMKPISLISINFDCQSSSNIFDLISKRPLWNRCHHRRDSIYLFSSRNECVDHLPHLQWYVGIKMNYIRFWANFHRSARFKPRFDIAYKPVFDLFSPMESH